MFLHKKKERKKPSDILNTSDKITLTNLSKVSNPQNQNHVSHISNLSEITEKTEDTQVHKKKPNLQINTILTETETKKIHSTKSMNSRNTMNPKTLITEENTTLPYTSTTSTQRKARSNIKYRPSEATTTTTTNSRINSIPRLPQKAKHFSNPPSTEPSQTPKFTLFPYTPSNITHTHNTHPTKNTALPHIYNPPTLAHNTLHLPHHSTTNTKTNTKTNTNRTNNSTTQEFKINEITEIKMTEKNEKNEMTVKNEINEMNEMNEFGSNIGFGIELKGGSLGNSGLQSDRHTQSRMKRLLIAKIKGETAISSFNHTNQTQLLCRNRSLVPSNRTDRLRTQNNLNRIREVNATRQLSLNPSMKYSANVNSACIQSSSNNSSLFLSGKLQNPNGSASQSVNVSVNQKVYNSAGRNFNNLNSSGNQNGNSNNLSFNYNYNLNYNLGSAGKGKPGSKDYLQKGNRNVKNRKNDENLLLDHFSDSDSDDSPEEDALISPLHYDLLDKVSLSFFY